MGYESWDQVKRKKRIRNILLILLALLLLAGAGYGGYHYYLRWKEKKQEENYEDLRERAFVTGTPTPTLTPEEIVKTTATPTPTHAPTAEEMLWAALYERYEEFFTIQPDFTILDAENEDIFAYIYGVLHTPQYRQVRLRITIWITTSTTPRDIPGVCIYKTAIPRPLRTNSSSSTATTCGTARCSEVCRATMIRHLSRSICISSCTRRAA